MRRAPGRPAPVVTIEVDGEHHEVAANANLAAVLMALDGAFRVHPVRAQTSAPYCFMGACFECLVEVDGQPDRQACLLNTRPAMVVRRQTLPASDFGYPHDATGREMNPAPNTSSGQRSERDRDND
jgi:predicted molibdopterin-dependent oxidoreductase YjgC